MMTPPTLRLEMALASETNFDHASSYERDVVDDRRQEVHPCLISRTQPMVTALYGESLPGPLRSPVFWKLVTSIVRKDLCIRTSRKCRSQLFCGTRFARRPKQELSDACPQVPEIPIRNLGLVPVIMETPFSSSRNGSDGRVAFASQLVTVHGAVDRTIRREENPARYSVMPHKEVPLDGPRVAGYASTSIRWILQKRLAVVITKMTKPRGSRREGR